MNKILMLVTFFSCAAWAAPSIEGTWTSPCAPVGTAYSYETLSFYLGHWSIAFYTYADATCRFDYLNQSRADGTYALGTEHGEGTAIDITTWGNSPSYTIYSIEHDNNADVLYLGRFAAAPDNRPKSVERDVVYYRQ